MYLILALAGSPTEGWLPFYLFCAAVGAGFAWLITSRDGYLLAQRNRTRFQLAASVVVPAALVIILTASPLYMAHALTEDIKKHILLSVGIAMISGAISHVIKRERGRPGGFSGIGL